jgi:hypothetical protein
MNEQGGDCAQSFHGPCARRLKRRCITHQCVP